MPKAGRWSASAGHYQTVVQQYTDGDCIKGDLAPRIAKLLAHRQEGCCGEGWNNLDATCGKWESRDVQVALTCGIHEGTVEVGNADGIGCWAFLEDVRLDGTEVCSASTIGNGDSIIGWDDRWGTYVRYSST